MNDLKKKMITSARQRFKRISPCRPYSSLLDCFTVEKNSIYFWFNTDDKSTHVVAKQLQ